MFRRRLLDGKGRNTRCSFHCNCLILGEVARPERFALPTFWFVTRGRNLLELAGTEKNAEKINKLLQAGANHLPFPLHFFFPISRRFAETCMTLLCTCCCRTTLRGRSCRLFARALLFQPSAYSRRVGTRLVVRRMLAIGEHRETVSHYAMTCESAGHVAPEATSTRQHA
jgi:hypothetical protein